MDDPLVIFKNIWAVVRVGLFFYICISLLYIHPLLCVEWTVLTGIYRFPELCITLRNLIPKAISKCLQFIEVFAFHMK